MNQNPLHTASRADAASRDAGPRPTSLRCQPASFGSSAGVRRSRSGRLRPTMRCERGSMRAIQITEFGGPEVLTVTDVPEPEAADGRVVVDVAAAGVNYADTHQAENTYLA